MHQSSQKNRLPRILIVRLTAIGDVVHSLPVLCALREHLPKAFLAWAVEGCSGDLLEGHPAIDALVRLPRKFLKSPQAIWKMHQRLRALNIGTAIDVQGLTKSALVARLSGATHRIGFEGSDGRELSSWLNNDRIEPLKTHVIERNLELLRPLGIRSPAIGYRVPQDHTAEKKVAAWLQKTGLRGNLAIINPGAGWPSKIWPARRYAAVASHLGTEHDFSCVAVWAGRQEHLWAQEVVNRAHGQARLAPPTTLRELASLARRARLFVGSDTGPLHLAAAVGTPCVGLYGPMPHQRNGPYGWPHVAVQKTVLTGTSRERRQASNESMLAIEVDDVFQACDTVIGRGSEAATTRCVA